MRLSAQTRERTVNLPFINVRIRGNPRTGQEYFIEVQAPAISDFDRNRTTNTILNMTKSGLEKIGEDSRRWDIRVGYEPGLLRTDQAGMQIVVSIGRQYTDRFQYVNATKVLEAVHGELVELINDRSLVIE